MIDDKKFIYSDFFFNRSELIVWTSIEENIAPVYNEPREYRSIQNIKYFDLEEITLTSDIFNRLGDEEKVRQNAVTMDQIEQLIKAQPNGEDGILLNINLANMFFVLGVNNYLFNVCVYRSSHSGRAYWKVQDTPLIRTNLWAKRDRVFWNEPLF